MQMESDKVDGNDEERADPAEFDDCFRLLAFNRAAADDELDFSRFSIALALGDFAREDNVFEIEDREIVIVKFFRSMYWWSQIATTSGSSSSPQRCRSPSPRTGR